VAEVTCDCRLRPLPDLDEDGDRAWLLHSPTLQVASSWEAEAGEASSVWEPARYLLYYPRRQLGER
jgi:hypothetical protein